MTQSKTLIQYIASRNIEKNQKQLTMGILSESIDCDNPEDLFFHLIDLILLKPRAKTLNPDPPSQNPSIFNKIFSHFQNILKQANKCAEAHGIMVQYSDRLEYFENGKRFC